MHTLVVNLSAKGTNIAGNVWPSTMIEDVAAQQQQTKYEWQQEQYRIASQVVIIPDEIDEEQPHTKIAVMEPNKAQSQQQSQLQQRERILTFGPNQQFHFIPLSWYDNINRQNEERPDFSFIHNGNYIGGVDVSFAKSDNEISHTDSHNIEPARDESSPMAVAAYVIIDVVEKKVIYSDMEQFHVTVPYIPSYLAFREVDPLVRLIRRQQIHHPQLNPRAILVDGNGVFHERFAGLACFVGVLTQIPTIGVGKTCSSVHGIEASQVNDDVERSLQEIVHEIQQNEGIEQKLKHRQQQIGGGVIFHRQPLETKSLSEDTRAATRFASSALAPATGTVDVVTHDKQSDRGPLVKLLTPTLCSGIAVPLVSPSNGQTRQTLACALVGHGGHATRGLKTCSRHDDTKNDRPTITISSGTKNPIFVSVGHQISLQEAVITVTRCCINARIPEPVRVADGIGRGWLRAIDAKDSTS